MEKLEFNFQNTYKTIVRVHIGYLNYSGHVGADGFLTILHEARVRYFAFHHLEELNMDGKGTFIIDSYVQYKGEIFHNDELEVEMKITEMEKSGFQIYYKAINVSTGKLIMLARMKMAFVDIRTHRLARIPEIFFNAFGKD